MLELIIGTAVVGTLVGMVTRRRMTDTEKELYTHKQVRIAKESIHILKTSVDIAGDKLVALQQDQLVKEAQFIALARHKPELARRATTIGKIGSDLDKKSASVKSELEAKRIMMETKLAKYI